MRLETGFDYDEPAHEAASQFARGASMPKSWWGKTLMWGYLAGYCIYVAAAAINAWPQMPFAAWSSHVLWQATYASFWPLLVLLNLSGVQW